MTVSQYLQETYARRRKNFLALTEGKSNPSIAATMRVTKVSVNGFKHGHRHITEIRARLIEQSFGLSFGDLDK
ncbi:hypothetical protein [Cupriavidus basilensis]